MVVSWGSVLGTLVRKWSLKKKAESAEGQSRSNPESSIVMLSSVTLSASGERKSLYSQNGKMARAHMVRRLDGPPLCCFNDSAVLCDP